MRNALTRSWQELIHGQPGSRFEDRYNAARKVRSSREWRHRFLRFVRLGLALGALVVGFILVFIPGPAVVFFFLSGSLLAAESRGIARFLDALELKLRAVWDWGKRHWRRLSLGGKVALVVVVAALGAAGAYGAYQFMAR
jgi:hypothetical protein